MRARAHGSHCSPSNQAQSDRPHHGASLLCLHCIADLSMATGCIWNMAGFMTTTILSSFGSLQRVARRSSLVHALSSPEASRELHQWPALTRFSSMPGGIGSISALLLVHSTYLACCVMLYITHWHLSATDIPVFVIDAVPWARHVLFLRLNVIHNKQPNIFRT